VALDVVIRIVAVEVENWEEDDDDDDDEPLELWPKKEFILKFIFKNKSKLTIAS
jgi:hypothetical protein